MIWSKKTNIAIFIRWKARRPIREEACQGSSLWWLWWSSRWCEYRDRSIRKSAILMQHVYRSRLSVPVSSLLFPRPKRTSAVPMVVLVVLTVSETALSVLSWSKNKRLSRRSSRLKNKFLDSQTQTLIFSFSKQKKEINHPQHYSLDVNIYYTVYMRIWKTCEWVVGTVRWRKQEGKWGLRYWVLAYLACFRSHVPCRNLEIMQRFNMMVVSEKRESTW